MNVAGSSISLSFQRTSPSSSGMSPRTALSSVVLPEPTSPATAVTVPPLRSKLTSRMPLSVPG